jgi:4-hydroxybenzoate polyprenyltransferase
MLIIVLYAVAVSFNNLADVQTDAINKRTDNPLISGVSTRHQLIGFTLVAFIAVIGLQLFLAQPVTLLLGGLYLLLAIAYSHPHIQLQKRGLIGTAVLALCYGVIPFYIGASQGSALSMLTPLFIIFEGVLIVPLLLAKDYKDYKGDRQTKKLTPLVRYGAHAVVQLAYTVAAVALLLFMWLGILSQTPPWLLACLSMLYISFVYYLHALRGAENQWIKKLYILLLLLMTFVLI